MPLKIKVILLLVVLPSVTGNNETLTKSFVAKLENFVNVNSEQAQVIADYRDTIAFLTNMIEALNATVQEHKAQIADYRASLEALNNSVEASKSLGSEFNFVIGIDLISPVY